MSLSTKTLTFHSKDLGRSPTLLLTFNDKSIEGIYIDCFPMAWRVATFGAKGAYSMSATYRNQMAFVKPQIENGVISNASTWQDINLDQSTDLTESDGVFSFSAPGPGSKGFVQAWNKTPVGQDIALAFTYNSLGQPAPALFFPNVGAGHDIVSKYTPILKAYIITNYEQNQILDEAIQSPLLWEADLSSLGTGASLTLSYDISTATYKITQDFAAFDVTGLLGVFATLGGDDLKQIIKLLEAVNLKKQAKAIDDDEGNHRRAIEGVKPNNA